ncbi:hypothetical protein [Pseudomonas sp. GD03746]|uniref:hypothetical protein n=1 Tax=Pseudomonas sp. GD03746 TaxID=2975378 RepID=UPI002448B5AD|nr:hypothetical protein [Pseudomonas sp. GD03746]MDH1576537.1 hypothetical protein [Pseudomonas sp. GD03746]
MSTDEDKMIKKLEEHRDAIKLVVEIGQLHGISVTPSVNNDPRGDFIYPADKKSELIAALDLYLGQYKHSGEETDE